MTTAKDRRGWLVAMAEVLLASLLSSCQPCAPIWGPGYPDMGTGTVECGDCASAAKVCTKPTVQALAHDLDALEELIEKFGSVVVKQPDVWGQARLTKHREEFEKIMVAELSNFSFTLQGSISVTDQAYFADAAALSAAAVGTPRRGVISNSTATSAAAPAAQAPPPAPPPVPQPQPLPLPDQSDTFAAFSNINRTPVRTGPTLEFAGAKTGISVEPTVLLDQRARYLNHLHELRRINEGDDTADSPGYALNLVRIPVSILPGKCTDIGCGAEVTMTLTPYLSEELLPTTFRNLVMNDVIDQIGFPVTQFINDPTNNVYLSPQNVADIDSLIEFVLSKTNEAILNSQQEKDKVLAYLAKPNLKQLFERPEWIWFRQLGDYIKLHEVREHITVAGKTKEVHKRNNELSIAEQKLLEIAKDQELKKIGDLTPLIELKEQAVTDNEWKKMSPQSKIEILNKATEKVIKPLEKEAEKGSINREAMQKALSRSNARVSIPATKSRRARLPFPPSEIVDIYGYDFAYHLAADAYAVFARERFSKPCLDSDHVYIHLPDIQGYLQEEVNAAYQLLSSPCGAGLWSFCTPELAAAIRAHQKNRIFEVCMHFKAAMTAITMKEGIQHITIAALVWAILVESALLTDQLVQDMKESAAAKGCACLPTGWLPYFLPNPPPEARQAFNEYVRCRWPIHVFALDPATQQQNLADTFSSRREMQLALSLAFVSGQLSARNMMRFARRIEYDFATIDLNGTAIGFSHGDETFGWRFYPRFQTPDVESNFTVFFRDLLIGGPNRNDLLRQRRLEPGMRECVAIVIMPSFVPYATLNVSSNWFKLTNPKCKTLDASYAMKLSNVVKSIENCAPRVCDGDCYRDGDLVRLLQKVKQLETRLPLQSAMVQVPYENTLGGFAMFNTGITDLAPELIGWYGSPSINPKEPTTIFLVGNHFSVHGTRVIAGGQFVANTEMLSRQVMKAVIPAGPILMGDACQQFVGIHLATPYGVTQHLLVPVCNPPKQEGSHEGDSGKGIAWKPGIVTLAYTFSGVGIVPSSDPKANPPNLVIQPGDVDVNTYKIVDVTVKFDKGSRGPQSFSIPDVLFDPTQKGFLIQGDTFVKAVFAAVGPAYGPQATNPPCTLVTEATMLTFKKDKGPIPANAAPLFLLPPRTTANHLTIQWIKSP